MGCLRVIAVLSILTGLGFGIESNHGVGELSMSEARDVAMRRVKEEPEEALAWVKGFKDKEKRSYAMDGMVLACMETDPARAEAIWQSMDQDDRRKPYTIAYVIRGWARSGQVQKAEALARSIEDVKRRSELLTDVVSGLTGGRPPYERKSLQEAERVARIIEDKAIQIEQLRYLSLCWLDLDTQKATGLARSIEDPNARLDALYQVAYDLSGIDAQQAAALTSSLYASLKDQERRQALLRRVYLDYEDPAAKRAWAAQFSAEDRAFLKEVEEARKPVWERIPGALK